MYFITSMITYFLFCWGAFILPSQDVGYYTQANKWTNKGFITDQ